VKRAFFAILTFFLSLSGFTGPALSEEVYVPVLAPITGFLALEGGAQRNGAVLAAEHASTRHGIKFVADVQDTTTAPDVAVSAF
jgi:branched-chain amino acid transport system substrate-binding protein